jgi:DNA-binding XRE family transcriptional regulator
MTEDFKLTKTELAALRRRPLNGYRNKIRFALEARRLKQYELAAALGGMPASQVSELINGDYKDIYLDRTARRISALFGACIEDIFPPECASNGRAA